MAAEGATPKSYGFIHLHHISEIRGFTTLNTVFHKYMTFFIDDTVIYIFSALFSAILKQLFSPHLDCEVSIFQK